MMPRVPRFWHEGAIYHITDRGNRKAALFLDDQDHNKYLSLLAETKVKYPFSLHSYCLMFNHVHLLLETHQHHISEVMKNINTLYANYFNKRYDLNGHVFQGRFKSKYILDRSYFLNASRYIHLNPLEANIVTKLEDYPWSSYSSYHSSSQNTLVTTEKLLSQFPEPQLDHYLLFLNSLETTKETTS